MADWQWGVQNLLGLTHITVDNYHRDKNIYANEYYDAIREYQNKNGGRFWYDLPLTPDAKDLWKFISSYSVVFITATGNSELGAGKQKVSWVYDKFGQDCTILTVERTKEKQKFARPEYILIDDQQRALEGWIESGGVGIHHKSAQSTIEKLDDILNK